ncbi:MAG: hypothetical protein PF439_10630 [Helicobacteraceae bacterium]|nr:hypothetical protein [Helicobacteraceae bacterium]
MQEKKTTYYRAARVATETYHEDDAFITKRYYDDKSNTLKEIVTVRGTSKEIKHFTPSGVLSKKENFVKGVRHGIETRYVIPKANESVKSSKTYEDGKLHGECITYDQHDKIIKQELFALGKLVVQYIRKDDLANDIEAVKIVDKENIEKLPKAAYDKLQADMTNNPEWFTK